MARMERREQIARLVKRWRRSGETAAAFCREPIQTAALGLEALFLKEVQFGIVVNRPSPLAVSCAQFQSRQMVAGQMADQFGSTQDELTF